MRINVSPEFERDLDRFGEFLALVGLVSLVVGGVGVANAASAFVERKRASLAILKAIGASGGAVVALALIEFAIVAVVAVFIGLALGAATPYLVAAIAGASLPYRSRRRSTPKSRARRPLRAHDGADLLDRAARARARPPGGGAISRSRR